MRVSATESENDGRSLEMFLRCKTGGFGDRFDASMRYTDRSWIGAGVANGEKLLPV